MATEIGLFAFFTTKTLLISDGFCSVPVAGAVAFELECCFEHDIVKDARRNNKILVCIHYIIIVFLETYIYKTNNNYNNLIAARRHRRERLRERQRKHLIYVLGGIYKSTKWK
ncbi:hypothetical protein [Mucilaginibacter corticis]|uniref:hypothetical protein n=1 Tax=Mucilaginibacter corticis TaxID=2597670 RepID=UPI001642E527|nr:hypothetical protein [Mucilaginibacter corticis]